MTLDVVERPGRLTGWGSDLVTAAQIAERVGATEFVPAALRGKPDAITACILYGAEIGVSPMQALNGIHVVDGRPFPSAELMRAMIYAAGHTITVHDMTGTRVRVSGLRAGSPETERVYVEWTLDMGRAAGLLGRRNWQNYPRAMLLARATGDLARLLFADVVKGLGYVAEDVDSVAALDSWGPPELDAAEDPAPPKRKPLSRAKRPRPAPTPDPDPVEPPRAIPARPGNGSGDAPAPEKAQAEQTPTPPTAPPDESPRLAPPVAPPVPRYAPDDVPLPPDTMRTALGDLAPEAMPPEPGPVGAPISAGPLKALHTALGVELGTVATRDEKLAMLSAILGRRVTSSKTITRAEGYAALEFFGRVSKGEASWEFDPTTGAIMVTDPQGEAP